MAFTISKKIKKLSVKDKTLRIFNSNQKLNVYALYLELRIVNNQFNSQIKVFKIDFKLKTITYIICNLNCLK